MPAKKEVLSEEIVCISSPKNLLARFFIPYAWVLPEYDCVANMFNVLLYLIYELNVEPLQAFEHMGFEIKIGRVENETYSRYTHEESLKKIFPELILTKEKGKGKGKENNNKDHKLAIEYFLLYIHKFANISDFY